MQFFSVCTTVLAASCPTIRKGACENVSDRTCGSPTQSCGLGGRIEGQSLRVRGHGDVGKACVFAFRGSGAHVFVPECEFLCPLQACFKGVQATCKASLLPKLCCILPSFLIFAMMLMLLVNLLQ